MAARPAYGNCTSSRRRSRREGQEQITKKNAKEARGSQKTKKNSGKLLG